MIYMHGLHIFMSNGVKALVWCCLKFKCNTHCIFESSEMIYTPKIFTMLSIAFLTMRVSLTIYKTNPWTDCYVSYINYPINYHNKLIRFYGQLKPLSFQNYSIGPKQKNKYRFYKVSLTCHMIFWLYRMSI